MDDELEDLRKKRLKELQQQQMVSQEDLDGQEQQQKEIEKQRQSILRAILTTAARERLGRIKIARPEIAKNIEDQLILLAQQGQLKNKINDNELRDLLSRLFPKKRDIKIRRR